MSFVERIEKLLNDARIPKNKMLEDLSLSVNSFSNWRNRGTIPGGDTLQKIADYFGVTVDFLLGKTDIKEKAPDQDDQVQDKNVLRIAGRDGTYIERKLTDEQMRAFRLMVEQLPEADDL